MNQKSCRGHMDPWWRAVSSPACIMKSSAVVLLLRVITITCGWNWQELRESERRDGGRGLMYLLLSGLGSPLRWSFPARWASMDTSWLCLTTCSSTTTPNMAAVLADWSQARAQRTPLNMVRRWHYNMNWSCSCDVFFFLRNISKQIFILVLKSIYWIHTIIFVEPK